MSNWYWRVIAFKAAFFLTFFASYIIADEVKVLPFCDPQTTTQDSNTKDLIIVSTLDGKLTAFNTKDGNQIWFVETQPLLSSNLHHVELTSGGKWVRLVPSLRGGLYSLSGENLEPLPFDADQLLSSSFKYSDDLIIAGGRSSSWLGVDAASGSTRYSCGAAGCGAARPAASSESPLLVLRTRAAAVRALNPTTGQEKWNFSVGTHELALSKSTGCLGVQQPSEVPKDIDVLVSIKDGVLGVKVETFKWQRRLETPIVNMWRLAGGSLRPLDVLLHTIGSERSIQDDPPALYIGQHENQLYIQESPDYVSKLETSVTKVPFPWKLQHPRPLITAEAGNTVANVDNKALSLAVLNKDTRTQGFLMYLQDTCDQAVQVSVNTINDGPDIIQPNEDDRTEYHHIHHVHVYSLWYWWKEVTLIAFSSALLMNLMIWPRFFAPKFRPHSPMPLNKEYIVVERHYERPRLSSSSEYSGRYEKDFTPLRCLGKGGFGVVFEARNNIDHCSYAVKRIMLPRKESKRERVLREVRALAKLEHEHIVRYFNAWLEAPPPDWQRRADDLWMRELEGASVEMTEDYISTLPKKSRKKNDSLVLDLHKDIDNCIDALDFEKQLDSPSKRLRTRSCNDSFSIIFDDEASRPPMSIDNSTHPHFSVNISQPDSSSLHPNNTENGGGDNDDSFIVFANSEDISNGLSEARNITPLSKQLEKVKEIDNNSKSVTNKKKKGHTRHWSLDTCVRSTTDDKTEPVGRMYLYIQMQLCLRDSLHDWLRQNGTRQARKDKVKTLFSQIVSAVEYVHLAGLIHRDLKPSNIFFAPDGRVKIGDFGLVTDMSDNSSDGQCDNMNPYSKHTNKVGTHLYMSPEQLRGHPYSYKVDIYSLGLILFELLYPFGTESERVATLQQLRNEQYPANFDHTYPAESKVLKMMLSADPSNRPTAMGVKARAPLFQETDEKWHFTLPTLAGGG